MGVEETSGAKARVLSDRVRTLQRDNFILQCAEIERDFLVMPVDGECVEQVERRRERLYTSLQVQWIWSHLAGIII